MKEWVNPGPNSRLCVNCNRRSSAAWHTRIDWGKMQIAHASNPIPREGKCPLCNEWQKLN